MSEIVQICCNRHFSTLPCRSAVGPVLVLGAAALGGGAGEARPGEGDGGRGNLAREQYSTVQYSTVQYSTVQYSTVQYTRSRPGDGAETVTSVTSSHPPPVDVRYRYLCRY